MTERKKSLHEQPFKMRASNIVPGMLMPPRLGCDRPSHVFSVEELSNKIRISSVALAYSPGYRDYDPKDLVYVRLPGPSPKSFLKRANRKVRLWPKSWVDTNRRSHTWGWDEERNGYYFGNDFVSIDELREAMVADYPSIRQLFIQDSFLER